MQIGAKGFADFSADLVFVGDQVGNGAVLRDPFGGGFWPHAGDARDIIDRVAREGEHIAGLRGQIALLGQQAGRVNLLVGLNVVHDDLVVDHLIEIFILGAHIDFAVGVGGIVADFADERGHRVIRFESLGLVGGDSHDVHNLADAFDLRGHIVRHGLALSLIRGGDGLAAGGSGIHREHDMGGLARLKEFQQHAHEAEGGVGGFARGRSQPEHGEVGPINLGVAVDDVEGLIHSRNRRG